MCVKSRILAGFLLALASQQIKIMVIGQSRCMDASNLLDRNQMNLLIDRTFKALVKSGQCASKEEEGNAADRDLPPDTIKVPPRVANSPLNVALSLYIEQLSNILDQDMTFRIDFYVMQKWTAQRTYCNLYKKLLAERFIRLSDYNSSGDMLQMNSDFFKFFWLPDSYITNAKSTEMQSSTLATRSLQVYVQPNTLQNGGDDTGGEICRLQLSARYASIIPCRMNFRNFPVDTQKCNFSIKSFSFPMDEVILHWEHMPMINKLQLPQHTSRVFATNSTYVAVLSRPMFQNTTVDRIPDEYKFTELVVTLILSRDISNKLAGVYIPTALIVLVCLSTFWYGPGSITDRITVGTTALLALITQFIDTRKYLPPISYISEIDIWMIMCMVFVCVQLVQGTIVHYYYIQAKRDRKRKLEKREAELRNRVQEEEQQAALIRQKDWLSPASYTPPANNSLSNANSNDTEMSGPRNRFDYNRANMMQQLNMESTWTAGGGAGFVKRNNFTDYQSNPSFSASSQTPPTKIERFWASPSGKLYWKVFGTKVPKTSSAYIPELIDTHSRVLILLAFFLFAVIYWANIGKVIANGSIYR